MKMPEWILDWLFPPKCVFCRKLMDETDICPECAAKLPYTKGDSITQKLPYIKSCVTPLFYDGTVREAILRYKFWGMAVYAHRFGLIMSDCIENNLDCGDIDVISWVPLSKKRLRKRGYNQAQLLAEVISETLGIPLAATLEKTVDNPPQSGTKTAGDRARNVRGVYSPIDPEQIKGKAVLLVDDVVTTGSTLSECARVLKMSGSLYVYCTTIARHKD